MKQFPHFLFIFLFSLILVSACGGGNSSSSEPTDSSRTASATKVAATEVVNETEEVVETAKTAVSSESDAGIVINCSLDNGRKEISCEGSGHKEGTRLSWSSNATSATSGGSYWIFSLESVPATIVIEVEACFRSDCQLITTQIDATHLMQDSDSQGGSASRQTEQTSTETATGRERRHSAADEKDRSMQSEYSRGECDPNGPVILVHSPVDVSTISMVEPMGGVSYDHITPIDHMYFFHNPDSLWEIYAMADGHIVYLAWNSSTQYRMVVEHSCSLYTIYIHIQELPEDLELAMGLSSADRSKDLRIYPRVAVNAGDLLGYDVVNGRGSLDISVVDTRVVLDGFVNLETYKGEFWKKHCVDPFDYWKGSFKDEILKKTLIVNDDPPGGKIDRDIVGRLVGNWFLEGSGGYSGARIASDPHGSGGHLYFGYSNMVPNTKLISMGAFERKKSFHLADNALDPADISVETGIVKYGLRALNQGDRGDGTGYKVLATGELWDGKTYPEGGVLEAIYHPGVNGVVVVQVLNDQQIKVEAFQDARSLEAVSGFTENAKIYVR